MKKQKDPRRVIGRKHREYFIKMRNSTIRSLYTPERILQIARGFDVAPKYLKEYYKDPDATINKIRDRVLGLVPFDRAIEKLKKLGKNDEAEIVEQCAVFGFTIHGAGEDNTTHKITLTRGDTSIKIIFDDLGI